MEISIKPMPGREGIILQEVINKALSDLPYFILIADLKGKILFINQAALDAFGYNNSTITQKTIGELLFNALGNSSAAKIAEALTSSGHWNGEEIIRRPDGTQTVLELKAVKIDSQMGLIHLYSGQEVTGQRYGQRESCQMEKLSARGEMAGEISHELNNYLSIIMGNLELLGMGIAKGNIDSLASRIKSMREGLTRLTRFVEGLMSIARPEAGYESIDLREFIEREVFFIKQDPRYAGIEFVYNLEDEIPPVEVVLCRLRHALIIIFSNACDALALVPAGQKKITIDTAYVPTDDSIRLSVSDNGCGMSEEDYQKLFRQFFSTKGSGHGFGLLAIKSGIKSQGGKVYAAPSIDGGVCITIEFPRQCTSPIARTAKAPI